MGRIGFDGRFDYAAIGSVTNLSARLCAEADSGQILATERVLASAGDLVDTAPMGEVQLRGFSRAVRIHDVLALRPTSSPTTAHTPQQVQ